MHALFDLLAWIVGPLFGLWVRRRWLAEVPAPSLRQHPLYFAAAMIGMAVGAFGLGTLNLVISGHPGIGRSVVGGLFGAIAAVELYKLCRGYAGSTGLAFVAPLARSTAPSFALPRSEDCWAAPPTRETERPTLMAGRIPEKNKLGSR